MPVSIGGCVVEPGDVVVGDADGVVTFGQAVAADLLARVRQQEEREAEVIRMVQDGRYDGRYARPGR